MTCGLISFDLLRLGAPCGSAASYCGVSRTWLLWNRLWWTRSRTPPSSTTTQSSLGRVFNRTRKKEENAFTACFYNYIIQRVIKYAEERPDPDTLDDTQLNISQRKLHVTKKPCKNWHDFKTFLGCYKRKSLLMRDQNVAFFSTKSPQRLSVTFTYNNGIIIMEFGRPQSTLLLARILNRTFLAKRLWSAFFLNHFHPSFLPAGTVSIVDKRPKL